MSVSVERVGGHNINHQSGKIQGTVYDCQHCFYKDNIKNDKAWEVVASPVGLHYNPL